MAITASSLSDSDRLLTLQSRQSHCRGRHQNRCGHSSPSAPPVANAFRLTLTYCTTWQIIWAALLTRQGTFSGRPCWSDLRSYATRPGPRHCHARHGLDPLLMRLDQDLGYIGIN